MKREASKPGRRTAGRHADMQGGGWVPGSSLSQFGAGQVVVWRQTSRSLAPDNSRLAPDKLQFGARQLPSGARQVHVWRQTSLLGARRDPIWRQTSPSLAPDKSTWRQTSPHLAPDNSRLAPDKSTFGARQVYLAPDKSTSGARQVVPGARQVVPGARHHLSRDGSRRQTSLCLAPDVSTCLAPGNPLVWRQWFPTDVLP